LGSNKEKTVTADWRAYSECERDLARGYRQSARENSFKRRERRPDARTVRHSQDESHGELGSLCETPPLELAGAQLSLEVDQGPLDLDLDDLIGPHEKDVCSATISWGDRRLDTSRPAAVQCR
jgi:hypothetical protein